MFVLDVNVKTRAKRRGVWDLFGIGDPHLDKKQCDEDRLKRWIGHIAGQGPYGLAWCVGDVMDGTLPGHKFFRASTIRQDDLAQMEDYVAHMVERGVALFQPIVDAGIPLVLQEGNHDIRIAGLGFIQMLVRALNGGKLYGGLVQYGGGEALVRVRADGAIWTIYGAHGAGGGGLPGARVNRQQRDAHIADADVFIRGHVEEADARVVDRYTVPKTGKARLATRPVAFYTCAGHAARRIPNVVDYSGRASMGPLDRRIQWLEIHNPTRDTITKPSSHDGCIYVNDFRG